MGQDGASRQFCEGRRLQAVDTSLSRLAACCRRWRWRGATPRLDLSSLREMANDKTLTEPPLSPVRWVAGPGFTF